MTIVIDHGDYWIEHHALPIQNVAGGAAYDSINNAPDRPGIVAGWWTSPWAALVANILSPFMFIGPAATAIRFTYGATLTLYRVLIRNNSGGAVDIAADVWLLMKK